MNQLAFMGVLQRGETVTRRGGSALPDGQSYLLTTPFGQAIVIEQDKDRITIKNVGPGLASYMIFVVDPTGLARLAAVRNVVAAFSKPKPRTP